MPLIGTLDDYGQPDSVSMQVRLAKQKKIDGDFPVPCEVREASDATEISLAENEMREAMYPADRFDAFKKLATRTRGGCFAIGYKSSVSCLGRRMWPPS